MKKAIGEIVQILEFDPISRGYEMIDENLLKSNEVHLSGISYPLMHILLHMIRTDVHFSRKIYVKVINIYLEYVITKMTGIGSVNP